VVRSRTTLSTEELRRRGVRLEYATIAWNVVEVFITIGLGLAAGSLALVAFGLDSIIEVVASSVVVWHERHPDAGSDAARTSRAHRLIGAAFFALAAFLAVLAIQRLLTGATPDESPLGIVYLAATVVVMFSLAVAKHRVADRLGSTPLRAEAAMTYLDALLAGTVLLALVAVATVGWGWVDAVAALIVAALAFREGWENWEGDW
jgi:divalent metal cation (Fe/Co/Zn/Cd) transporter